MKMKSRYKTFQIIGLTVLILYTVTLLGCLLWAFMNTFKRGLVFSDDPFGFPKPFVFSNYKDMYNVLSVPIGNTTVRLPKLILFTIVYAGGCAFLGNFVTCITAYAIAKFKFRFSGFLYSLNIVIMILPIIGTLGAEIQLTQTLGINGKWWILWVMRAHFLGIGLMIFHANFKGIPESFTEAAKIDGANNWAILFRIMFPLISKTFGLLLLLSFMGYWNDFQTPLIYMPNYPPIALALYRLSQGALVGTSFPPVKLAGAFVVFLPMLILFIVFNGKIIGNVSIGGVKE